MSRPALKLAPAPLSPARHALADAVLKCSELDRLHRANAEAHERAETALIDTYRLEDEANRALETAKTEAPARLAALFRGDDVEPAQTVEQCQAAVAAVLQKRVDLRAARDALAKETSRARSNAGWQQDEVKAAVAQVVKTSPEAQALFDAYVEAERRFTALRLAVDTLSRAGALPERAAGHKPEEPDRFLSHQWAATLDGLRSDYDAVLPKVP